MYLSERVKIFFLQRCIMLATLNSDQLTDIAQFICFSRIKFVSQSIDFLCIKIWYKHSYSAVEICAIFLIADPVSNLAYFIEQRLSALNSSCLQFYSSCCFKPLVEVKSVNLQTDTSKAQYTGEDDVAMRYFFLRNKKNVCVVRECTETQLCTKVHYLRLNCLSVFELYKSNSCIFSSLSISSFPQGFNS